MAECFLIRSGGGGEFHTLPVLDINYPENVTLTASADGSATFQVKIATDGKPAEYTYQWYVDGVAVSGATGTSYTKTDLISAKTYKVYCAVTNKAGTVESRYAILTVESYLPNTSTFSYSGDYEIQDEGNNQWYIVLKTGANDILTFAEDTNVDIFLVGGGGAGGGGGGGGGGGYVKTLRNQIFTGGTNYTVTIGAGGFGKGARGGTSSITQITGAIAEGGYGGHTGGSADGNGKGGNGGSGGGGGCSDWMDNDDASDDDIDGPGGAGGSNGSNGRNGNYGNGGTGDVPNVPNTYAFEDPNWYSPIGKNPYAGGGGGGNCYASSINHKYCGKGGNYGGGDATAAKDSPDRNGKANTGGGGSGDGYTGYRGDGGSGVILIRSAR